MRNIDDLKQQLITLKVAEPKLRARGLAKKIGISERANLTFDRWKCHPISR